MVNINSAEVNTFEKVLGGIKLVSGQAPPDLRKQVRFNQIVLFRVKDYAESQKSLVERHISR